MDEFISALKKPLLQLVLLKTPKARVTRSKRARERRDAELVPKRSVRLVTKSKSRAPRLEAQARKVMMKRLGVEVEIELPDEVSFDEFQMAFKLSLLPSTREQCRYYFQTGSNGHLIPFMRLDHPSTSQMPVKPKLGTNVFIWNVRGLNSWARRDVVCEFLV